MKVKTFWRILIKIIGLWLLVSSIAILPYLFSTMSLFYTEKIDSNFLIITFIGLAIIGIYAFITIMLIFRTDLIITQFQLEKGFEEEVILENSTKTNLLSIVVILFGSIIFIDTLPSFCKELFDFFQQNHIFRESKSAGWLIFHLIKTILGYVLITNSKVIVSFISKETESSN